MRKGSSLAWLCAFVALWCALRIFWVDADAGVPSLWEYGYNVTDEGYYMGAAKDKLLRGEFCDFAIGESFTYGYSPLTHWLAYAGYAAFGLNSWGWRVPFVALYLVAWCMVFLHVAQRSGAARSFAWCAVLSSLPVVVAYERTACNDATIAALAAIAFCTASGKGAWRIPVAATVAGAICLVKPSIWVLLPLVAAGVLSERKTKSAWIDIAAFAACSAVSVAIWRHLAVLSLAPEAPRHGVAAAELIRRTTTHNALPSLLDPGPILRGLSSFPRDICLKALGPAAPFATLVPLAMAVRDALRRKWTWRILLYLSVPAYVAGVSVNNSICLHYYHPALLAIPLLFAAIDGDLAEDAEPEPALSVSGSRRQWLVPAFAVAVAVAASFAAISSPPTTDAAAKTYSTISNLPNGIVWSINWGFCLLFAIALSAVLAFARGFGSVRREGVVWVLLGFCGASVALSGLPGFRLSFHLRQTGAAWMAPMAVSLSASAVFMAIAFGLPDAKSRRMAFSWLAPLACAVALAVVPAWRGGAVELLTTRPRLQRETADEIASLLPDDAIVIGERSRQVLMSKPFRTATTMPGCDPMPIVRRLFEADPSAHVFALADSQNAYNLQHFQKHSSEYRLDLVREFKMPSFANGSPARVYLCRIIPARRTTGAF